jgi:hypothetical protein
MSRCQYQTLVRRFQTTVVPLKRPEINSLKQSLLHTNLQICNDKRMINWHLHHTVADAGRCKPDDFVSSADCRASARKKRQSSLQNFFPPFDRSRHKKLTGTL